MYYETMLEKMAKAQLGYEGSPYQRLNSMSDAILQQYDEKQSKNDLIDMSFAINGKKVK